MPETVFRRRRVYRDPRDIRIFGGASIVSASVAAVSVVLAVTASGNTTGVSGEVLSSPVILTVAPITSANLEVAIPAQVALGVTATGLNLSLASTATPTVLTVTARCDALVNAPVVIAVTATIGSIFTMDATAAVVFAVTAPPQIGTTASAAVVIGCSPGTPDVTGGTVTSAGTASVVLAVTATGGFGSTNTVPDLFFIPAKFNVPVATLITSDAVTIMGNTQPADLTITNGEYSIDGADFASTDTTINAGQSLVVRHLSDADSGERATTTVIIGGITENFVSVTERAVITRPHRHGRFVFGKKGRRH